MGKLLLVVVMSLSASRLWRWSWWFQNEYLGKGKLSWWSDQMEWLVGTKIWLERQLQLLKTYGQKMSTTAISAVQMVAAAVEGVMLLI